MSERLRLDDFNAVPTRVPMLDGAELAALLAAVGRFVRRFVVLDAEQLVALVLWVVHTYVYDAGDCSPYLAVVSPEKRSGKTRLLAVLELLVARAWRVVTPSEAVVYRKVQRDHPTLLLDEVDAIWRTGQRNDNHEALRALLNAGNQAGVKVPRCSGSRGDELVEFDTYCPKALAGIGALPDTVGDRSIVLAMKRRAPSERVERFRRRELEDAAAAIRAALASWAEPALAALELARPALPDRTRRSRRRRLGAAALGRRHGRRPLWPERARRAALALSVGEQRDDESLAVQLLGDLRRIFDEHDADRMFTATLLEALHADDEAPWLSYGRASRPLSAQQLARLLHPYRIRSRDVHIDEQHAKGYLREQFEDAWQRYCTAPGESQPCSRANPHGYVENDPSDGSQPHGTESAANLHGQTDRTAARPEVAEGRANGNCGHSQRWRARDHVWRCTTCDPPAFAGEVIETRYGKP